MSDELLSYLKNTDLNKRNSCVPEPPKPGEVMICQGCGKPMLPKDFSDNELIRKREFKWQMHNKCMQEMEAKCDRQTPGLLSERAQRSR